MDRDSPYKQSLGKVLNHLVQDARVLMVGAGGIGCELLKNLVLTGFGEIHIVDLDTIDLSNLNRQFLFRQEHIKKSKALVAKEAAHKFNPKVNIVPYWANIKDDQFNIAWFKKFTIVFNALDNLEARRHVNKMCLAADLPLIESGTTGFKGQVQVIKKGVTACYDCTPKETPKTFPVCTIRSTPSQPIHCIVWGKSYLLNEIFGASEDDVPEMDHSEDSENANEIEKLRVESQALKVIRNSMGRPEFPQLLFDKVFKEDIERLRSMEDMWTTRRKPEPLDYTSLRKEIDTALSVDEVVKKDQSTWTQEENVLVFQNSLERLSKRLLDLQALWDGKSPVPIITFDKDDIDTLDFVAASANLRSMVFGIPTKSRFDIKQMAGNIIPAIATTNAIIAGLCVLQSFKVLRGDYDHTKEIYLSAFAHERLFSSDRVQSPNPDCPVCSVANISLGVDLSRATLNDLVEGVLRLELGYGDEIVVSSEMGTLYDVEEDENLQKKLSDLGVQNDSFLTVIDEDEENPRVNLVINVQAQSSVDNAAKAVYRLEGTPDEDTPDIPRKPKSAKPSQETNGDVPHTAADTVANGKRKAEVDLDFVEPAGKRPALAVRSVENGVNGQKGDPKPSDDLVVVEDGGDGTILIEDD